MLNPLARPRGALLGLVLLALLLLPTIVSAKPQATPDAEVPCTGGMAGMYPCSGVDLLSRMTIAQLGGGANAGLGNVWGWTDPQTSRRYVIQTRTDGTAFVDATDPANPIYLGNLPSHTTSAYYRDVKVYQNYAYIVADATNVGAHGMQIFDLTQLRNVTNPPAAFTETAHWAGFGNGHNLFINEETGFAYVVRTTIPSLCGGAMMMISLANPTQPTQAGCFSAGGLASDVQCVVYAGPDHDPINYHGRELCILASDDNILVADVTDKSNPQTLATVTYPDAQRAHLAWLTEDHRHFVSADMHDEHHAGLNTRIFAWDFTDVNAPTLRGWYTGPTAGTDHNVWVKGNRAYVGNSRAGLRVLDLTGIATATMTQAAFFDLFPANDNPGHEEGAWAAYVYFGDGLMAVTSKEDALFLLRETQDTSAVTLDDLGAGTPGASLPLALGLLAGAALLGLAARRAGA